MAVLVYEFIQGDDFVLPMSLTDPADADAPVDITGWVIQSQVRNSRKLVSALNVSILDAALGSFQLSLPKEETILWPTKELQCNVQFDRPLNGRISSDSFTILCKEDPTV